MQTAAANVHPASTHTRRRNCSTPITKHPRLGVQVKHDKALKVNTINGASGVSNFLYGHAGKTLMPNTWLKQAISDNVFKLMPTTAFEIGKKHSVLPNMSMHGAVTNAVVSVLQAVDALLTLQTTCATLKLKRH